MSTVHITIPKSMLFCFNKPHGFQQHVSLEMIGGHKGARVHPGSTMTDLLS